MPRFLWPLIGRSALIVSTSVVGMPCGEPLYGFQRSVPQQLRRRTSSTIWSSSPGIIKRRDIDLSFATCRRTAAICAKATAGVDVKRTLSAAAVDVGAASVLVKSIMPTCERRGAARPGFDPSTKGDIAPRLLPRYRLENEVGGTGFARNRALRSTANCSGGSSVCSRCGIVEKVVPLCDAAVRWRSAVYECVGGNSR